MHVWYILSLPYVDKTDLVEYTLLHVLSALTIPRMIYHTRVAGEPDQSGSRQSVQAERAVT